jgi:hypothetical protein
MSIYRLSDGGLYPNAASESFLAGNDRRKLQVGFYGLSEDEVDLEANLEAK